MCCVSYEAGEPSAISAAYNLAVSSGADSEAAAAFQAYVESVTRGASFGADITGSEMVSDLDLVPPTAEQQAAYDELLAKLADDDQTGAAAGLNMEGVSPDCPHEGSGLDKFDCKYDYQYVLLFRKARAEGGLNPSGKKAADKDAPPSDCSMCRC